MNKKISNNDFSWIGDTALRQKYTDIATRGAVEKRCSRKYVYQILPGGICS